MILGDPKTEIIPAATLDDTFRRTAARRPDASARRSRSAWTAGIAAAPGNVIPSASATQAIVLAVPITMQVPAVGASRSLTASTSRCSISPPR